MTLREALSQVPDLRAHNRRYPLWGLLVLILLAFLSRVDSLRGVARFARTHPPPPPPPGPAQSHRPSRLHRAAPPPGPRGLGPGPGRRLSRDGAGRGKGPGGEYCGGEVLAVLRAHRVSWLNRKGVRQKKAALEAFSFNPLAALRFLGLYAV